MKFKFLFVVAILFIYASSCKDDIVEPPTPFDHVAQEAKDRDSLQTYMQTHFVDADGLLQNITGDETPVKDLVQTIHVTYAPYGSEEEVNYELYYYMIEEGLNDSPTVVDVVNVSYEGFFTDAEVFDQNNYGGDFHLDGSVIPGWSYALPYFKSGYPEEQEDGSFEYFDTGRGILFVPSGLAYADRGSASGAIAPNTPLLFYVELNTVFRTDYDDDTILSMYEDINGNGDYKDDDTDADGTPNYRDADDDGDGTLTKDEDADGDGDVTNDDTDGDGIPNYLDLDN